MTHTLRIFDGKVNMEFNIETILEFSKESVFEAYRDQMKEIAEYLPNMKEIIPQLREEKTETEMLVSNLWKAKAEVPTLLKSFIKPEMLEWVNYTIWNSEKFTANWRIETNFMRETLICKGKYHFLEEPGNHCLLKINGEIRIIPDNLPVPGFLKKSAASQAEAFIVKLLKPNYEKTGACISSYLKDKKE